MSLLTFRLHKMKTKILNMGVQVEIYEGSERSCRLWNETCSPIFTQNETGSSYVWIQKWKL